MKDCLINIFLIYESLYETTTNVRSYRGTSMIQTHKKIISLRKETFDILLSSLDKKSVVFLFDLIELVNVNKP